MNASSTWASGIHFFACKLVVSCSDCVVCVDPSTLLDFDAMSLKAAPMIRTEHNDSQSSIPGREWDGRSTLRSLSDALVKLRDLDALETDDTVLIKTLMIDMPDGRSTGFVVVIGPRRVGESSTRVLMPASGAFRARTTLGNYRTYDIAMLDEAMSDADGNVKLKDGSYVHAVDLVPSPLLRDLTEAEEEVVECAIKILGEEDRCYLPCHETLPPDVQLLHYENIAQIRIPSLKALQNELRKNFPDLSDWFITQTLKFAGMRTTRTA